VLLRAYLIFFSWGGVILVKCGWFAGLGIIWSVSKGLISLFRLEKQTSRENHRSKESETQRSREAKKQRNMEKQKSKESGNTIIKKQTKINLIPCHFLKHMKHFLLKSYARRRANI